MPIDHIFCEDLTFVAKFNGEVINGVTKPLSYNEVDQKFTAESDDDDLITLLLPYSVEASFTNYPISDNSNVSTAVAKADVGFNNPCLDPFTFLATPQQTNNLAFGFDATIQTNPASDAYTEDDIVFNLIRFTIDPPRCKILYSCTSVLRVDGTDSDISCDNL